MSRKNPETSIEAYKKLTPEMLNEHHKKILEGLRKLGQATSEEIASEITLAKDQVYRRMNELVAVGIIYNTTVKKPTRSGRAAFVYAIVKIEAAQEEKIFTQQELFG
jgi:predicted transcriptional regulator